MKTEITNKAFEYIDAIAKKMGVAADHVYGILVKQAIVGGVRNLVIGVFLLVLLFPLSKVLKHLYKTKTPYNDNEIGIGFTAFAMLGLIITGVIVICIGIGQVVNPEYYAIKDILDAITGGNND